MKKSFQFVAVLMFLVPLAVAQEGRISREGGSWVQEITGTLAGARNLRVRVDAGSVRVEGGQQAGITYTVRNHAFTSAEDRARREFDSYKVSASVRGDTALIEADWQGGHDHRFNGEFVIRVPREIVSVKVETDGGNVVTTGIAGRAEVRTGGGSIRMDDIGGAVIAETGGDSIEIGTIGGNLDVQTGGGRVSIGSVNGKINASTGGGDVVLVSSKQGADIEAGGGNIQVKQCGGSLRVSTGGGNIELGDIAGSVEIETGGGGIRVGSSRGMVRAETGAGTIELGGVSAAHAETGAGAIIATFIVEGQRTDSTLETSAGDVTVYLAPTLNVTVQAAIELADGHTIRSDFSDIHITTEGDWGAKTVIAEGKVNGGGPVLKLRTTTGDILIRRSR